MNYPDLLPLVKNYKKIVITGPARSGTAIATRILSCDLCLPYLREEEFGITEPQRFFNLIRERENFVLQAPCMSSLCHWLEDCCVIFMLRSKKDILNSQKRVNWQGEELERLFYFSLLSKEPISVIKYYFWNKIQKNILGNRGYELDYESLKCHNLWVNKEDRVNFTGRQTSLNEG